MPNPYRYKNHQNFIVDVYKIIWLILISSKMTIEISKVQMYLLLVVLGKGGGGVSEGKIAIAKAFDVM